MSELWRDAPSAEVLARRLLGAELHVRDDDGTVTSGRIVETEAYLAVGDPGCHAHRGPTRRNASMFMAAGTVYVYRIYGLHHCFNIVSGREGRGEAVLVRALEPRRGQLEMARRRGLSRPGAPGQSHERRSGRANRGLADGPGKLVEALGIRPDDDGSQIDGGRFTLTPAAAPIAAHRLRVTRRIGLGQAEDLALRFVVRD